MARLSIRNLNAIYNDKNLYLVAQALDDLLNHISTQQATINTLNSQVQALQKKAG